MLKIDFWQKRIIKTTLQRFLRLLKWSIIQPSSLYNLKGLKLPLSEDCSLKPQINDKRIFSKIIPRVPVKCFQSLLYSKYTGWLVRNERPRIFIFIRKDSFYLPRISAKFRSVHNWKQLVQRKSNLVCN